MVHAETTVESEMGKDINSMGGKFSLVSVEYFLLEHVLSEFPVW